MIDEKTLVRFWSRVNKRGPVHPVLATRCWLWLGTTNSRDYGRFTFAGKSIKATKASLLIHGKKISGPCVLHKCDNPPCVRPSHLFTGTIQDNNADMKRKGRNRAVLGGEGHHWHTDPTTVTRGERNNTAKLTESDVRTIRRLYAERKETQTSLAKRYGVSQPSISLILSRKHWAHVLD